MNPFQPLRTAPQQVGVASENKWMGLLKNVIETA